MNYDIQMMPSNVSEADFARWNRERAKDKATIENLLNKVSELEGEVYHWRQEAMKGITRG